MRQELINEGVRIIDLPTDEFTRLFKYGLLTKILSNKELLSEVKDNRLPIVHYYIMDGKIIYKPRFDWLADLVTDIHVAIVGY